MARSAGRLRRTDVVWTKQGQVAMLLHGADEHDALTALRRLGVTGPVSVRLARGIDELTGVASFTGERAPTKAS